MRATTNDMHQRAVKLKKEDSTSTLLQENSSSEGCVIKKNAAAIDQRARPFLLVLCLLAILSFTVFYLLFCLLTAGTIDKSMFWIGYDEAGKVNRIGALGNWKTVADESESLALDDGADDINGTLGLENDFISKIGIEAFSYEENYQLYSALPFYKVLNSVVRKKVATDDLKNGAKQVTASVTWSNLNSVFTSGDGSSEKSNVNFIYQTLAGWDDGLYLSSNLGKPYSFNSTAPEHHRFAKIENHLPIVHVRDAYVVDDGRVLDTYGRGYELSVGCCRYQKSLYTMEGLKVPSSVEKTNKFYDSVVVLAHSHSTTYYHAVFESFPKIFWLLDLLESKPEVKVVVGGWWSIVVDLITSLGIARDRIVEASYKSPIFAKNVYIPPHFCTTDHYAIVRRVRDFMRARLGLFDSLYRDQCAAFSAQGNSYENMTFYNGDNVDYAATFADNRDKSLTVKQYASVGGIRSPPEFDGRVIVLLHRPKRGDGTDSRTFGNFHFLLERLIKAFPQEQFVVFRGNENDSFNLAVKLFRCAKLVVGVHGAGLTNTIFANPGTPMIDLTEDRQVENFVFETVTYAMYQPIHVLQLNGIDQFKAWNVTENQALHITKAIRNALKSSTIGNGSVTSVIDRHAIAHRYDREVLHPERHFPKGYTYSPKSKRIY